MMYKKILFASLVLGLFATFEGQRNNVFAKTVQLIKAGDFFPETRLAVPKAPADRAYLTLKEIENFALMEIKADVVIVEILSVHCPSCQRQALVFNKLFNLIENDAQTRGRIKIVGIAVGNGDREVQDFARNYKIPYPIIPDPHFELHDAIGGSRTPFTIIVRFDPSDLTGIVADTHLGPYRQHKRLFKKVKKLMAADLATIREKARKAKAESIVVKPILSDNELAQKVKEILAPSPDAVIQFQQVPLNNGRRVYTGIVRENDIRRRLIAEVVSRPPTCDVCHDIHFIYVLDTTGKILKFVPLHLTKYGNKVWTAEDIAKMRRQVVGKNITDPLIFNPEVDAVSKATITSAIIYDSISRGESLLKALKEKGFI